MFGYSTIIIIFQLNQLIILLEIMDNEEGICKLNEVLETKVDKNRNKINELHNKRYNDDLQIEIDTIEWVLEHIQKKKINPNGWIKNCYPKQN